jgi:hypothetical protein
MEQAQMGTQNQAQKFEAVTVGQVFALEDDNGRPGEIVEILEVDSDEHSQIAFLGDDRYMRLPIYGWLQL